MRDDAGEDIRIIQGDAVEVMRTLPDGSIDAIISDPIYPEIDRSYGRISEADWHVLMRGVVGEARRVLKPHGSAVFILQPNSERVGRMRPWLYDFQSWLCRDWNIVQDVYWWNTVVMPEALSIQGKLLRPSLKHLVWCGPSDCCRDQDSVLWDETLRNRQLRMQDRFTRKVSPSQVREGTTPRTVDGKRMGAAAEARGGVTPFNVLPIANTNSTNSSGSHGHGAGTPFALADWWTRYITRPGDTILDPFSGSGTMPLAAQARGRKAIGIERDAGYVEISRRRIEAAKLPMFDEPRGQAESPPTASTSVAPPMFAFAEEDDHR